jgi:ubiquinone biosynthesis protein UbiJ
MLEAQLNGYLARALDRSPRARELCHLLDGRRLRVLIDGVPGALCMKVADGTLHATHERSDAATGAGAADVTIRGSPLGLLALAGAEASETVMRGSASVEGEESLAQQFQELARLLRPDIEAGMGKFVGRMPAHLAARAFTLLAGWGRAARESVMRNTADYLAHESRDLVPRAEAEGHFSGVDALRSEVARAEARIAKLAEQVTALTPRGTA